MNTYMSVTLSNFGMNSNLNHAYIYISVDSCQLEVCHKVSWKDGVKELAKLAKKLNKVPKFSSNYWNPDICYRELSGYLD